MAQSDVSTSFDQGTVQNLTMIAVMNDNKRKEIFTLKQQEPANVQQFSLKNDKLLIEYKKNNWSLFPFVWLTQGVSKFFSHQTPYYIVRILLHIKLGLQKPCTVGVECHVYQDGSCYSMADLQSISISGKTFHLKPQSSAVPPVA